jgi:hypothetical protein
MLDHANLNAVSMDGAFGLTEADHSLLIPPLFHVNAGSWWARSPHSSAGAPLAGRLTPGAFRPCRTQPGDILFPPCRPSTMLHADLAADLPSDTSSLRFAVAVRRGQRRLLNRFANTAYRNCEGR